MKRVNQNFAPIVVNVFGDLVIDLKLFKKIRFRKNYCLICYCRTLDPRICHRFWLKEALVNEKRIKLGFEGNYIIKCYYQNPVPEVN